jgi:HTH-type transcriptional regulator / antitoxin MqsA
MIARAAVCPVCGAGEMEVVRERRSVAADDGATLHFDDEFTRCRKCGVDYYTRDQSLASSRARAGVLRAHEGLLSPQDIRAIRERLGYTQAQLEGALRVGPKTVVRWEKGTVRQSRAVDRLLRVLATHPEHVLGTATYAVGGTAALATVLGSQSVFTPGGPAGAFWPLVLPQGFAIATTTMWSRAVYLNQPAEAEQELQGVLEAAPSALALAA